MVLQRHTYDALGPAAGPYSHAVQHGQLLYSSGLTAFGTPAQSGSAGDQTDAILEQLKQIAGHHGKSLKDLVKVTVFITSPDDIPAIRNALTSAYGSTPPASAMVQVAGLFSSDLLVEIEAIFGL